MNTGDSKLFPVLITPFDLKGKIDYQVLGRLIKFYLAAGAEGFFVNCYSSEMYSLDEDERVEQATFVAKMVNKRVPVLATGSFGLSIYDKADFCKRIIKTGIDAVLLINGHFANVDDSDDVLIKNVEHILRLTDGIPMGLYECSVPYKRVLSADVLNKLLQTQRIFYYKDATVDRELLAAKIDVANRHNDVRFFESYSPNSLQALNAGVAGVSSIAGVFFPEIVTWLCTNATDPNKTKEVEWIQEVLTSADEVMHLAYPMSAKYILRKRGLPIRLISRVHVKELTKEEKKSLDNLYESFLSWCKHLNIDAVNVEDVLLPDTRLDPAF